MVNKIQFSLEEVEVGRQAWGWNPWPPRGVMVEGAVPTLLTACV